MKKTNGYIIFDPTKTIIQKPLIIDPGPTKPLKWHQKVHRFFYRIYDSNAFSWFMIILLKGLQGACVGFLIWWCLGGYRMFG